MGMQTIGRWVLVASLLLGWAAVGQAQTRKLVRVPVQNRQQAEKLMAMHLDFASHALRRFADIVVTAREEKLLREQGFQPQTLVEDLRQSFAERFAGETDLGAYHTYQEMVTELQTLAADHPDITHLVSIGQSIEGRDIWAMKVSDNPGVEEADEPDLLYMANMHAREMVTPEIIFYFLNYLIDNYGADPAVTDLVNNREFWLIPTQNPDGHVYVENVDSWWRKNRRHNFDGSYGVDLNRNYSYQWGYDNIGSSPDPSSETYRGTGPFSEPESEAIHQFCVSHNFVLSLSFHSYGRMWLYPWGYVAQNTPENDIFVELAANCVALNGYTPGNPANGVIYITNGDTDDYFYGEQAEKNRMFGFTPEVGDEFWPPESQIVPLAQENLGPMLYLARVADIIADNPQRLFPPATPVIAPMDTDADGNFTVNWSINDDPANPAVAYELQELSGFAAVTDGAEAGSGNWQFHDFVISTARNHTGMHSFYSGQGDNLNRSMTTAMPMIVPEGGLLSFWAWYQIETNWDYAYVEISTNGGRGFFSIPGNITTNSNPNGTNLGNGITGSSAGWVHAVFDLSGYAGQTILIRFRYVTDGYVTGEGFYADDIEPVPTFASVETLANNITGSQFEVTGRTAGTYFYQVRARDAEQQWGGWSPLEDIEVLEGSIGGTVIASAGCNDSLWYQCPADFPITVDVSGTSPPVQLGAYAFTLTWDPALLQYSGYTAGEAPFDQPVVDTSNTAAGSLQATQSSANGAAGLVHLLSVRFQVIGEPNSQGSPGLSFSKLDAASGADLLPITTADACLFSIKKSCLGGDVTVDDAATVFDALVISSYSVGLEVPAEYLQQIRLGCGDVTADGETSVFDALIVATYAAGLPVEPYVVGELLCP